MRRPRGFDDLAVDADPSAVGVDLVGGEGDVLAPAHPGVGDEQDLQFPPPHPGPLGGRGGEGVDGVDGGDLLLGDGLVDRLGRRRSISPCQRTPRSRSWRPRRWPSSRPAATSPVRQRRRCCGDRRGAGLVDDLLEVGAGQLPARHLADHREDVVVAVPGLLVAMPDRPRLDPRRPARRVEVVGDEVARPWPGRARSARERARRSTISLALAIAAARSRAVVSLRLRRSSHRIRQ